MLQSDQPRPAETSANRKSKNIILKTLAAVGVGALLVHGSRLWLKVFGSNLPYGLPQPPNDLLDSGEFVRFLAITTGAAEHAGPFPLYPSEWLPSAVSLIELAGPGGVPSLSPARYQCLVRISALPVRP